MKRFILLQLILVCILGAIWYQGWVDLVLKSDQTYISVAIFVLFLCGLYKVARKKWNWARYIHERLVMWGMGGTVVGFIIALSGVIPSAATDIESVLPMVVTLIQGMGTALFTTLVGLVTHEWLGLVIFLHKRNG